MKNNLPDARVAPLTPRDRNRLYWRLTGQAWRLLAAVITLRASKIDQIGKDARELHLRLGHQDWTAL
jgi:hypothetical protein